jgi:hypothetical protein
MILLLKRQNWFRNAALLSGAWMLSMLSCAPGFSQAPKGTLPAHQATLSWTAGTSTTSSNAYRCPGTCSLASGTFTVLNSAPITATTYADTGVSANTQYSWCVTGLVTLQTGPFETACSNIVTATIPKDAAGAPSGLAVGVQ